MFWKDDNGFIIEFHIVYFIKQKSNIQLEYYKTQSVVMHMSVL